MTTTADKLPTGFFAYASTPRSIPATIKAAIESINRTQQAKITSWETLGIGGKYIIQEICDKIDDCDFFCADVTTINPNVMFELGFSIARDKRIWLVRDDSYVDSKTEFDQLRLLTTVGYISYTNAEQIIKGFFSDSPHLTPEDTIFRKSIEPLLAPSKGNEPLLYLKRRHDTEASVRASRILENLNPRPILDDPKESSVQPLYWYGQKILFAPGVVAHFLSPQREGSKLTNARYALVAGLALGFDRPLLMLTEQQEVLTPMDYRDQMKYYTTPAEAGKLTEEWLQTNVGNSTALAVGGKLSYVSAIKLATELRDFHQQLGEYIAENEAELLPDYFVETTAHMDIINGTQTIFVGRKGTGKTASLIQVAHEIGRETSNLVCILKPVGYEMDGLARLFASYKQSDQKGYVIESLWKYMLYTELALATAGQLRSATPWLLGDDPYSRLIALIESEERALGGDFIVRLESAVSKLTAVSSRNRTSTDPVRSSAKKRTSAAISEFRPIINTMESVSPHPIAAVPA